MRVRLAATPVPGFTLASPARRTGTAFWRESVGVTTLTPALSLRREREGLLCGSGEKLGLVIGDEGVAKGLQVAVHDA
ncbi:MAG: hypothetical protein AMXMBFR61_04800 [Fimbriimonadales bacterium]